MMIIENETTWMEGELKSSQFFFTSTCTIPASADWASIWCSESSGNYGTVGDWQLKKK